MSQRLLVSSLGLAVAIGLLGMGQDDGAAKKDQGKSAADRPAAAKRSGVPVVELETASEP